MHGLDVVPVEIAHEALLREWPRLRRWIEDDAGDRHVREHLARAAADWDRGGRTSAELYRGSRLAAALDWLNAFSPARMTGTGGCVFAAFDSEAEAQAVADQLPDNLSGFVARGVNRSPLLAAMD